MYIGLMDLKSIGGINCDIIFYPALDPFEQNGLQFSLRHQRHAISGKSSSVVHE